MTKTIEIKQQNIVTAFNKADAKGKQLLQDLFGKENVSCDIMDLIHDFDDILSFSGKTIADIQKPGDTEDEIAYKQAKLIAEVYNGGVVLDAFNTDQRKHYPIHIVSGSALSFDDCGHWYTLSFVGVRLCFADPRHAVDAGKKFNQIYTKLKTA